MRVSLFILLLLSISLVNCEIARKEESQSQLSKNDKSDSSSKSNKNGVTIGIKIGEQAPDISLPSPTGEIKTLSSLRGKYILLDFWASWCGPCRFENPNVVRLYQKYSTKDFDVLSVSLDSDQKRWLNAIEADGMNWNHVSDLKKWESSVVPLYKIDGIPMTFLLDKNGIIIAKNLRGAELEKKMESIFEEKK